MYEYYLAFLTTFSLTETDAKMIGVGMVFFLLLYKYLQYKVFVPILAHVEHREGATTGVLDTAAALRQKATMLQEQYDSEVFKARVEGNLKKIEVVEQAKKQATQIQSEADAEVVKILEQGRAVIAQQLEQARATAAQSSAAIADLIAQRVDSDLSVH